MLSRNAQTNLMDFPVDTEVVVAKAEGKWTPTKFESTGRIVFENGIITRSICEDDDEAVIVKLNNNDSIRISCAALRSSKTMSETR